MVSTFSFFVLWAQVCLIHAAAIPLEQFMSKSTTPRTILGRILHPVTDKDDDEDQPNSRPNDDSYDPNPTNLADSLTPANQYAPHWPFLAAKILASIAALAVIFIIVFYLRRRCLRARRRRIGEMMGLGFKRNEVLEAKHGKAGSRRRGREERKGHVRLHSWRWGGSMEGSSDEESEMEEGSTLGQGGGGQLARRGTA